jgi:thioredoxin-like negative regulator of GroEL
MQASRYDEASIELEAALLARPDSQSAALALATLELQRGDAAKAFTTAQATIDKRRTDDDPWRLFLYGHHPMLKDKIAALRAQVKLVAQ